MKFFEKRKLIIGIASPTTIDRDYGPYLDLTDYSVTNQLLNTLHSLLRFTVSKMMAKVDKQKKKKRSKKRSTSGSSSEEVLPKTNTRNKKRQAIEPPASRPAPVFAYPQPGLKSINMKQ